MADDKSNKPQEQINSRLGNLNGTFLSAQIDQETNDSLPNQLAGVAGPLEILSYSCPAMENRPQSIWVRVLLICSAFAVVAGLALPLFERPPVRSSRSPIAAAKTDISSFETAIDAFEIDAGRFPTPAEGTAALVQQPPGADGWSGPYLKKIAIDPWGLPYNYIIPGTRSSGSYDIFSAGPDGIIGTTDDIGNW